MIGVEDGLPIRPLPVWVPDQPIVAAGQQPSVPVRVETAVRTVVQNVLNGLFGGN